MEQWMQLQDFWDRLNPSRRLLNSAVACSLMKKTPEEIVTLLSELSKDAEQWSTDQWDQRISTRVQQVESSVAMQAQIVAMAKDIKQLTMAQETIKAVSLSSGTTLTDPVVEARPEVVNKQTGTPSKGVKSKKARVVRYKRRLKSRHMPALPFPQKMKREKLDKCFWRYLEMLQKLYVNIPLIECHIAKQIPQKCGDPGSFTIPCSLRSEKFDKALYEFWGIYKSMPLSVFRKLEGEIGVIKSIPVSLQLADQTTILPEEIIEDILMWVDKFVFPVNFIVVDMEVKNEVPLILGRPFLCTDRAILDIYEGKLMLRADNEKVVFQVKRMMKFPQ
uniref:Uncharacterized protein n=1 Tax=Nicotiana tabacum TaxID=4097 RepID=A0A1S4AXQ1_TOBAC|nr:PREDICTED: uncharacterized protein LOC107802313 [Nicotiana tabacum]